MRRPRLVVAVVTAAVVALGSIGAGTLAAPASASPAGGLPAVQAARAMPGTYTNPVSAGAVDTFPDPTMIRGKDGAWYAYGTTNPIFNSRGETGEHILPMLRSTDLVTWTYAGDVIAIGEQPSYWPTNARAWAPDIRYVDGLYHLTYALSTGGIALVTSPSPTGPWTDHGLILPAAGNGCPTGAIDQASFTDGDGTPYLYWGSYDTICVQQLTPDQLHVTGEVTQVAQGRRAEGGFVVHRDGHYYLFFSDAGCCDGEFSGYTVKVGRADSPRGPFVTQDGQSLVDQRSKGGIVLSPNGNGWDGPGHNALQTDLSGQDWLVYHAVPEATPNFPPVNGATGGVLPALARRPLLIDRLDWIDGWPTVRAGAGASSGPEKAPVTTALAGSTFAKRSDTSGWVASGSTAATWSYAVVPDAGGVVSQKKASATASSYLAPTAVKGDLRVVGDLRMTSTGASGAVGLVVAQKDDANSVTAWLDRGRGALVVKVVKNGKVTESAAALPPSFDWTSWHAVSAERRGTSLAVEVSADLLRDPVAAATATVPVWAGGAKIGAASLGAPGQADNLSAAALYVPVTSRVPDPEVGALIPSSSDEFDGAAGRPEVTDPAWSWVRGDGATAVEGDGALTWPTQNGDLAGTINTAPVLVRDAPIGDYVVETKLTFDGTVNGPQAGLVLYEDDDRYLKLAHSVLPLNNIGAVTHQTEFLKEAERPTTVPPTAVFSGPIFGGPPATTTWLRLLVHEDVAGAEHDVRMASSTDGEHWTWGGTWSLPVKGDLRIGLVSMGRTGATSTFDYLRTYAVARGSAS